MIKQKQYNQDWFRSRALESLQRIENQKWDFSDSALIYAPEGAVEYESIQGDASMYAQMITEPEHVYLRAIADDVADALPDDFDYVDLGPGTEHKEQYLFDALQRLGKTFRYVPVDIDPGYLKRAEEYAHAQGIESTRILSSFEDLAKQPTDPSRVRFVSLGLTFGNFFPEVGIELLSQIAGPNGHFFIDVQLRDRVDMDTITRTYESMTQGLCATKLRLLDLDPEKDVSELYADDAIRVWCDVVRPSTAMQQKGIVAGDTLMMLQSLRYTKVELDTQLTKLDVQYRALDTGAPFLGYICATQ